MPQRIFYCLPAVNAVGGHDMQDEGSAPAATLFSPISGWIVGSTVAARSSLLVPQSERGASTFTTTDDPLNNVARIRGFETPVRLTGVVPAMNWTFGLSVRATTSGGAQDGRFRMRLFKYTADNVRTELTNPAVSGIVSTIVTNLTATAVQSPLATFPLPEVVLEDESLYVALAWLTTGAASNNGADVNIFAGANSRLVVPDLQPLPEVVAGDLVGGVRI